MQIPLGAAVSVSVIEKRLLSPASGSSPVDEEVGADDLRSLQLLKNLTELHSRVNQQPPSPSTTFSGVEDATCAPHMQATEQPLEEAVSLHEGACMRG